MSTPIVAIVGGGLAGLAASIALADSGFQVQLFERSPRLGGRATSYALSGNETIDNCQHVTLRCCTNLEDFYRRIDRKSTRLNSSHLGISYAVFCLKKKKKKRIN